MRSDWKQITLSKAEVWLRKHTTPLPLRELGWRLVVFVAACGRSNPISFALRPWAGHKRLKAGVGSMLVVMAIIGAGITPLPGLANDAGGSFELATVGVGEVPLTTDEAVVNPLPQIEISQKYWLLHAGVDMRAPEGTPIKPVMAGRVSVVETERWGYGKHVIVEHDNGYQSLYAHMSEVRVTEGQAVRTEDTLGEVGSTGRSTGPHLHLEVRENGKTLNPATLLDLRPLEAGIF